MKEGVKWFHEILPDFSWCSTSQHPACFPALVTHWQKTKMQRQSKGQKILQDSFSKNLFILWTALTNHISVLYCSPTSVWMAFVQHQSIGNSFLLVNRELAWIWAFNFPVCPQCAGWGCQRQQVTLVAHLHTPGELGCEQTANASLSQASLSWLPVKTTNYHHKSCSHSSSGK